jgi:hypothetical protein
MDGGAGPRIRPASAALRQRRVDDRCPTEVRQRIVAKQSNAIDRFQLLPVMARTEPRAVIQLLRHLRVAGGVPQTRLSWKSTQRSSELPPMNSAIRRRLEYPPPPCPHRELAIAECKPLRSPPTQVGGRTEIGGTKMVNGTPLQRCSALLKRSTTTFRQNYLRYPKMGSCFDSSDVLAGSPRVARRVFLRQVPGIC